MSPSRAGVKPDALRADMGKVTAPRPLTRLASSPAVWLWLSVAVAVSVVVLGSIGSSAALPLGHAYSGAVTTVGAVVAIVLGRTGSLGWPTFRVLFIIGGIIWGTGQLVLAAEVVAGRTHFPGIGDAISGAAAPFGLIGLALAPRRVTEPRQALRLACEVLMLGAATSALLWRVVFVDVFALDTAKGATGFALVVAEVLLLSLVLITATREVTRPLTLVLVGVAVFVAGDLFTMYAIAQDGSWPWPSAALQCIAWTLVVIGVVQLPASASALSDRRLVRAEWRRVVLHAVVLFLMVTGICLSLLSAEPVDGVTVALYLAVMLGFMGREIVRAHQSRQMMTRLSDQALVDPLTGLQNRRALTERLEEAGNASGGVSGISVLTLDLDDFKGVNARLGNAAGDQLLRTIGADLADRCHAWGATAYRLGSDEFAVVYEATPDKVSVLAESLALLVPSAGASLPGLGSGALTVSVGVAHAGSSDSEAADPAGLVLRSVQALQAAKQGGRGQVVTFDAPLVARTQRRLDVERRLRHQTANGGVDVHYQPIIDLTTGSMVAMEALARWTDDELGFVPPDEFIKVAEDCGLIDQLGWQILRTALEGYISSGAAAQAMKIGVNVSSMQLRSPDFSSRFAALLAEMRISAVRVVVEVTESAFVDEHGPTIDNLFALAEAGTPIALDDFGTGYSSLSYLGRLPVVTLKLDRSLTVHLDEPRTLAIARSVADLASHLELTVVVEGIETQDLEGIAQGIGAGLGQGWLYSKAVPLERLPEVMASLTAPVSSAASAALVTAEEIGRLVSQRPRAQAGLESGPLTAG